MVTKWKNKKIYIEVFPEVHFINDGKYYYDSVVPNYLYNAVFTAVEEVNSVLAGAFKFIPRNNTGPVWSRVPFPTVTPLDHARVYFFVANHEQKQKPIGGQDRGNAESWQQTNSKGFRTYNYPVFGLDVQKDANKASNMQTRYTFEDATDPAAVERRIRWAMLHELTHGLGPGHKDIESPSVMSGHHQIGKGWDGHYFINDKNFLKDLYGVPVPVVEPPKTGGRPWWDWRNRR